MNLKASNYPYRGGKKDVWEGGVAGDGFISGPAMQSLGIPKGESDHLFHAVDWLPTLADIGGVSSNGKPLDGVSHFDALRENRKARNETFVGYSGWQGNITVMDLFAAIRYGKWKLIREPAGDKFLLFDLETDPGESEDLSHLFPNRVSSLKDRLEAYESIFSPPVDKYDKTCPSFTFTNTSWGQKAWQPWCG